MKRQFYIRKQLAYTTDCSQDIRKCPVMITLKEDGFDCNSCYVPGTHHVYFDSSRTALHDEEIDAMFARTVELICRNCIKKNQGVQK